jgi:hypothetical protein
MIIFKIFKNIFLQKDIHSMTSCSYLKHNNLVHMMPKYQTDKILIEITVKDKKGL